MNRSNHPSKDTTSVADSFQKLYGDLPVQISIQSSIECNPENDSTARKSPFNQNIANSQSTAQEEDSEVVGFLKEHLPRSDHKEIKDELKKTFPLHKQKGGKIKKPQPKRKGKYLTAHERRKLGLNRLPKTGGLKVF